jgi:hypothetical protein
MSEGRRKRHDSLKAAYGDLYTEVSRLLREADPIRLIAIGAPDDEYDPEVSTILPRLREANSANDVQRIVHEEFVHWFGAETAGPASYYAGVSEDIWEAWNEHAVST